MPTLITYNDTQILSGQATPLFGITENAIRYSEKWGTSYLISLAGSVSGCTYNTIITQQQRLLNIFSKDYQPLKIIENNQVLFESNYNIIRDVNFDSSKYVGLLNYEVSIESYPANLFSGVYGILNPRDEWEYVETDEQVLELVHTVSANGFNTSSGISNAFENCKSFVLSRTGMANYVAPFFTSYCTGATPCIYEGPTEQIDRFGMSYSVTEKYRADTYNGGIGIIRWISNYECNALNGAAQLSIEGNVQSCKNADLATLRSKYQSFDVYSAAVRAYYEACGRTDLNSNYLSSGITEDVFTKKINFNVTFDNDFNPRTYLEYETDIKIDDNDITTVGVKGSIKSRGDLKTKWILVQDYFKNQLNLYNLACQSYNEFYNNAPVYPLNSVQLDYSVTRNMFISQIDVSTSYSNKDILPPEFQSLDFNISITPAIRQIKSFPLVNLGQSSVCNLNYYTSDLGFNNRSQISIAGRANGACTGNASTTLSGIKNLANYWLTNLYYPDRIFLDKNNITQSNESKGNSFNFSFAWSMDSKSSATVSPYSFVNTLSLK